MNSGQDPDEQHPSTAQNGKMGPVSWAQDTTGIQSPGICHDTNKKNARFVSHRPSTGEGLFYLRSNHAKNEPSERLSDETGRTYCPMHQNCQEGQNLKPEGHICSIPHFSASPPGNQSGEMDEMRACSNHANLRPYSVFMVKAREMHHQTRRNAQKAKIYSLSACCDVQLFLPPER